MLFTCKRDTGIRPAAVVLATLSLCAATVAVPPTFTRHVIDSTFYGDGIAIGDIDGDGWSDVVVAGKKMVWYGYSTWTKHIVAEPNSEFLADVQVADMDRDGDNDLVTADGGGLNNIIWLENPRIGGGTAWTRHVIGSQGEFKWDWVTDLHVADLDTNGTMEVITRGSSYTHVFIDTTQSNKNDLWIDRNLTFSTMKDLQALELCDMTGDMRPDLMLNGYFLETPSFDIIEGEYNQKFIMSGWPPRTTPGVGDINGDGRNEAAFVDADQESRIAIYSTASNPPGTQWTEFPVYGSTGYVRSMKFADIDGDGKKDIVFAEMDGYVESRLAYLIAGDTLSEWTLQVIDSCGSYNIQVADLGKNGDVDIVGCNIDKGPVYYWENKRNGANAGTRRSPGPSASIPQVRLLSAGSGTVSVSVPANSSFRGAVMDLRGTVVRELRGTGASTVNMRGLGLARGTYLVTVQSGGVADRVVMTVQK